MSAVSSVQNNYKIELSIPHILTLKTSSVIAHSFVCVFSVTRYLLMPVPTGICVYN